MAAIKGRDLKMNKVENVQVSDISEDEERTNAEYKEFITYYL